MSPLAERLAERWPAVALGVLAAGWMLGWVTRGTWNRSRVVVRAVLAPGGAIRGWRAHLGRLSLGPLREQRRDAERHADNIREEL